MTKASHRTARPRGPMGYVIGVLLSAAIILLYVFVLSRGALP